MMTNFGSANISIGGIKTLNNAAALRNHLPRFVKDGDSVIVSGRITPGDGNGGIFTWSESNTQPDDGITVIKPAISIASGRWLLSVGAGALGLNTGTITFFIQGNDLKVAVKGSDGVTRSGTIVLT